MLSILLVTTKQPLMKIFEGENFSKKYDYIGNVSNRDDVIPTIEQLTSERKKIDLVIFTEGTLTHSGRTTSTIMCQLKVIHPEIRILFLAGLVDINDVPRINVLGELVKNGIYDIYHDKKISEGIMSELIDNPKRYADVTYLTKYLDQGIDASDGYKNIVMVSSIKPGSGKSFLSTNLAVAIAKYGKNTIDGRRPRVAIVEGDLQTLSIGTLLQIEDPKHNLREALRAVSTVVNENGFLVGSDEDIAKVEKQVQSCFVRHDSIDNLYVLAGSQMSLSDMSLINSHQYYFLIQSIVNYFDVIIVDTNSSLEHKSTGPLLELADHCYYLLDLDSNNIRNNIRYKKELTELNVASKIYYVLNRNLTAEVQNECLETLNYSAKDVEEAGFNLTAKIPMMDISIAYNRIYRGFPVVLDVSDKVKSIRSELIKIANTTWPIDMRLVNAETGKLEEAPSHTNDKKAKKKKAKAKKPWWKFW